MRIINNRVSYIPFYNVFDKGRPSAPCKDCSNRKIGCHANCSRYIEYKTQLEQYKQEYENRTTYYYL